MESMLQREVMALNVNIGRGQKTLMIFVCVNEKPSPCMEVQGQSDTTGTSWIQKNRNQQKGVRKRRPTKAEYRDINATGRITHTDDDMIEDDMMKWVAMCVGEKESLDLGDLPCLRHWCSQANQFGEDTKCHVGKELMSTNVAVYAMFLCRAGKSYEMIPYGHTKT